MRLRSITYAARDTHLFEFIREDGGALPAASPGAHVDLQLANGLTRSYSLLNSGASPQAYVVGVKRDPQGRGGSRFVHEQLRVGALQAVSAPRNHFPLCEDADHSVLIAGGIGITPIWSMLQHLESKGASWELRYSCRSSIDVLFPEELQRYGDRVHLHIDDAQQQRLDMGAVVAAAPSGAHLYCCGPAPMLAAYQAAAAHLPPETVHLEHFAATQSAATDGGYVVRLVRSGEELLVPPGNSILDVLLTHGIHVDSSCRQGICGACEVGVLEGEVDHRDAILSPDEQAANRSMMVCCSGARGACLVLDL